MSHSSAVQVRRVYDHRVRGDGTRVLVDRVWPRGMTKEKADLDEWCKQIAPSKALRTASKAVDISEATVLAALLQ